MRILVLVLLIAGVLPFSLLAQRPQGEYEFKLDVYHQTTVNNHSYNCSYYEVNTEYQNGNNPQVVYRNFGENSNYLTQLNITVPVNNKIIKLHDHSRRRWSNIFGCAGSVEGWKDILIPSANYYNCTEIYDTDPWGNMNSLGGYIKVNINPKNMSSFLTQPLENSMPSDDAVEIKANYIGFDAPVYNWEFSLDNGTNWIAFPSSFQGLDSMRISGNQLLAGSIYNLDNYIGKNLWIRISNCSGSITSNVIIYNLKKSPPNITRITVTAPRCFDTDDGKVKFTFDRALLNGESLLLNLRDSTHTGLIYFRQITDADLDAAHAYTFPDNLQPAEYYLVYQGKYTYVDGTGATVISQSNIKQSDLFTVVAPTAVAFTTTQVNVWCYGGNDGTVSIQATGGAGSYEYMIKRSGQPDSAWYPFSAASQHTITGLSANTWLLQIRDGNQCYAKTVAGGTVITQTIVITQPASPLHHSLVALVNPSGFGLSDGSIEVEVNGGTPKADGSYNFQWTTLAGTLITTGITTTVTGTGYRIKLSGLADGSYILNSNDFNFSSATANGGCMATDTFKVKQPLPLQVKVEILDSIKCKGDNNGSLVAHGEGGIKFTSGNPYQYTWKKQNSSGVYVIMAAQTDSIATGLASGWYAVNIKDANGITLAQDSTFFLPEPVLLTVAISHTDVTCAGLPNGSATAIPAGGTAPYGYEWSTGETTATISNLTAGTYLVLIKDRNHCQVQQNVVIAQPGAMRVAVNRQQPLCFNSCDGKLTATLSGGTAPFTYQWQGSSSTNNIAAGLCSGNYQLTITDANGCSLLQKDTLLNPAPLPVSLGNDRFICASQSIGYDITIPGAAGISYQWSSSNGFTSNQPKVTLTQAGTYYASVTDANGCNSKDTLLLMSAGTTISNEFALPTQAFVNEQIVVVNTSNPPADSIKWILPQQASVADRSTQFAAFTLADTGAYFIKLVTYRGMCYAEQSKKVIVSSRTALNSTGATRNPFIKVFTAAPNPNNGSFTIRVTLQEKAAVQLKLINVLTNQVSSLIYQSGSDSYVLPVNVSVVAGTYVLLLETPKGSTTMKIVIL